MNKSHTKIDFLIGYPVKNADMPNKEKTPRQVHPAGANIMISINLG
jgi:hypothetical protein